MENENKTETRIVYFDEAGDDGIAGSSSDHFLLTAVYMKSTVWKQNWNTLKEMRKFLKNFYGLHVSEEFHTKDFLTDKNPYRNYGWNVQTKHAILTQIASTIANLDITIVNVIIDKTHFNTADYPVLENALTYSIQRIENDSNGLWNYLIITDKGRISPMRKTARKICAYNPIPSHFTSFYNDAPIKNMIEDILEKDSKDSYFIQVCDFISYFVHLFFKTILKGEALPNRVATVIDKNFVQKIMDLLKESGKLNLKASKTNKYGLVIYPK